MHLPFVIFSTRSSSHLGYMGSASVAQAGANQKLTVPPGFSSIMQTIAHNRYCGHLNRDQSPSEQEVMLRNKSGCGYTTQSSFARPNCSLPPPPSFWSASCNNRSIYRSAGMGGLGTDPFKWETSWWIGMHWESQEANSLPRPL